MGRIANQTKIHSRRKVSVSVSIQALTNTTQCRISQTVKRHLHPLSGLPTVFLELAPIIPSKRLWGHLFVVHSRPLPLISIKLDSQPTEWSIIAALIVIAISQQILPSNDDETGGSVAEIPNFCDELVCRDEEGCRRVSACPRISNKIPESGGN